jgi:Co/Zn/Cd efflux system component
MLAKPHAWSNLFGPGQFIGVGLPFLLIMAAGMSSFIASITSASLMLIALAMALATELYFIFVWVFARGVRSQGRFSPTHVLNYVHASSPLLLVASIIFPIWILGLLFIRLFRPAHVETNLIIIVAGSTFLVNGIAAILMEKTICRSRHFRSRSGLLKRLLTPSVIALGGGIFAIFTDIELIIDDIGALMIMVWFMSSMRPEDLGV